MKMKKKMLHVITAALVLSAVLLTCACGGEKGGFDCPFSQVEWTVTPEALTSALGEPEEKYASVYGGETYVYAGDYLGEHGSVKYMFSEEGRLASMAWSLTGEPEEIGRVLKELNDAETGLRGESGFRSDNSAANGNVWYLDEGDIMLTGVTVNGTAALQYAYIAREFSKRDESPVVQ